MKRSDEFTRFEKMTDVLLKVPHAEIQKREAEYKEQSAKNPHKRGPKPKGTKK